MVVLRGRSDVEIVPLARIPLGINSVESERDYCEDVRFERFFRPRRIYFRRSDVFYVVGKRYVDVFRIFVRSTEMNGNRFGNFDFLQNVGGRGFGTARILLVRFCKQRVRRNVVNNVSAYGVGIIGRNRHEIYSKHARLTGIGLDFVYDYGKVVGDVYVNVGNRVGNGV